MKKNYREYKRGVGNIWFGARDGYLMRRLFRVMYPDVKTDYFLTSRVSAIRAGMFTDDDVAYVDGMKYSGTLEDMKRLSSMRMRDC